MPRKRSLTGRPEKITNRAANSRSRHIDSDAGASFASSNASEVSPEDMDANPNEELSNVQSTSHFVAPGSKKLKIVANVVGTPVSTQASSSCVSVTASIPSQESLAGLTDNSTTQDLANVPSTSTFVAPRAKKTRTVADVVGTPVSSQALSSRDSVRREPVVAVRGDANTRQSARIIDDVVGTPVSSQASSSVVAVRGGVNTRQSARRIKLNEDHTEQLAMRMQKVISDYQDRPWPTMLVITPKTPRRRSSGVNASTRCGDACDCTSLAQCQQNASAFLAACNYLKLFKLGIEAPLMFNHTSADYYDSGQFGHFACQYCGARLLRGEQEKIKGGRLTPCCANGTVHTEQMLTEFNELQQPPKDFIEGLVVMKDERVREAFLNNTMPFNNTFAFASTHGEKAPAEQMGGRMDTCKYNGEFSFLFSDLIAPGGRRPTFAQVYTLTPEAAMGIREEHFDTALAQHIKREILEKLEVLMRQNPFGMTFEAVGTKLEAAKTATGELPHFRIALLTDRDLKCEALKNRGDVTVIERADAPSAKQVAVIWVDEDGLPPQISGFWICDKAGKMRELKNGMPQIDPCCFPLLHPRGTLGWRWFLKKRGCEVNRKEQGQMQVQDVLDQSMDVSYSDEDVIVQEVGTNDDNILEEMPEPEYELDEEQAQTQGTITDDRVGTSAQTTEDTQEDAVFENEVPAGELGRTNISERQFYRYRMALRGDVKDSFHWLWFARRLAEFFSISVLNRIERNELNHLKAIQVKKNYRRILAREYIAAMEKGLQKWGRNAKLGSVFLMPQTFAGSRQYYQGKYADLMTMVRHLGAPTWFVTFTGNPKWPEITEALRGRQNFAHRPDVICRIFMDKATEFIRDVTERCVLGRVAGWCYSVEHQKRGMPHIHMLLILEKGGRITSPEQVDEYVCARIPKLPPPNDTSPEAKQQRRLWHYVTTMMLHDCNAACLEGSRCRKHFPKPYSDHTELSEVRYTNYVRLAPEEGDFGVAPRRGDENQPMDEDHIPGADPERDWAEVRYQRIPHRGRVPDRQHGECGQTHFKKRKGGRSALLLDDSRVIPYNPYLLLKYGCHVNIEYVFGQKACKYIFKYLLKGFEKAYVQVVQPRGGASRWSGDDTDQVFDYDEIAATFKVRYMTAMEAFLRLNSYKIVGTSHQIYTLSVHDEGGQTIVVEEGHEEEGSWKVKDNTRLTAFFKLCGADPDAAQLTYDRVPYHYSWNYKARAWKKRVRPLTEDPDKARMFVRVYTVSPRKHELFAIRMLLLHRPGPKSFEDLRTVDGTLFPTFAGAAQHLGLQVSDELFKRTMREACAEISNLKRLQHFFAMLIAHAHPSEPQRLFDEFVDEMNPPVAGAYPGAVPKTHARRAAEIMKNIEYFLNCMGTNSGDVGLSGLPDDYDFQRQATILEQDSLLDDFYGGDANQRRKSPQQVAVEQVARLNVDQMAAFDKISQALLGGGEHKLFFLEGAGGCGKTFFYNTLIKWCVAGKPMLSASHDNAWGRDEMTLKRSAVIAAASTGIAALLLIGGGTAHRHFYVPNDVGDETPPMLNFESTKAQHLRDADLIIIDEISMLSNKVLRYIDRLLRDVCAGAAPFGGKAIVLSGDWRQLAPVVEHGTREDQVAESIKMEKLFKSFKKLSLTINMRTAAGETSLREWLGRIGNGISDVGTNQLLIPPQLLSPTLEDAIQFCFPEALFSDPLENADAIANNAVLCPTNNDVQYINELALTRMSGDAKDFPSIDEPLEPNDEFHNFRTDFNIEAVHNEMPSGMPPHKLFLKVGTPIMLIRNLDVTQGLCNGTRLQVMRMAEDSLFCRILTGPRADAGHVVVLPRIQFEYGRGRHHRGLRFRRLQFPIRPCFAMTINKAQGQTLQRMALVLNGKQCFSHGQVYVAMSRVTQMDGIRVFAPFCQRGDDNNTYITNVVYHELLDDCVGSHNPVGTREQESLVQVDTTPIRHLNLAFNEFGVGTSANAPENNDVLSSDDDYFD
ncbi:hypothetical protein niasHS_017226 [Heterodera schachtii]|uniref:ATP-dependent DNA helicase n=1 Tax=Heterodera schachtii TaxID=97005 RepID=A0ABD2I6Z9_HETSC